MKRPEQHETDSAADTIFRAVFTKWAVTPSERDYGWDYVVFKEHQSTGMLFTGQLKGSSHTEYSADGSFISQVSEQDSADYLARQLQQPTFLFHVDVNAKKLFWSAIQLDQKVLAAIEQGDTKSLTVRIPTSNVLPGEIQRFLADLTQSQMAVISRILLGTKSVDFVDAMARQPVERISELAEDLHVKGFHLELQLAHQQRQQGDLDGAAQAVKKVLANSSSYVEIQFNGTLQMGELEGYQLMKSTEPQSQRRGQEARNSAQTLQNRKTAAPIPSSLCADYAEGRRVGSGGSENDRIADDLARTQDARRSLMVGGPFIPASGEPSC